LTPTSFGRRETAFADRGLDSGDRETSVLGWAGALGTRGSIATGCPGGAGAVIPTGGATAELGMTSARAAIPMTRITAKGDLRER
jgi:hypothetical protein